MDLTGGGAFYSLTPRRILADLEVNELKANPPYPPAWLLAINGSTGKAHRLDLSPSARNPLYQKGANNGSFSKGAGAKHLRIFNQEILRPSAEIFSRNLTTNSHNDKIKSPLPPLLVCSRLTGLRARLSALTLRPQLASRFTKGGKIPAFTLAEVLITLGIIGIVAAMTLPMLAENYQRRVVETRLKKFYTTFNQAILRAVDEHGPYVGWGYFVTETRDQDGNKIDKSDLIASNFDFYLRKYLSVIQVREIHYTNNQKGYLYSLSDGSAFTLGTHHNRDISFYPKHAEDCLRKRGQHDITGVCEFRFIFYPFAPANDPNWKYHRGNALEPYLYSWNGTLEGFYSDIGTGENGYGCNVDEYGMLCTALIAYHGWQIPDNYPRKIKW